MVTEGYCHSTFFIGSGKGWTRIVEQGLVPGTIFQRLRDLNAAQAVGGSKPSTTQPHCMVLKCCRTWSKSTFWKAIAGKVIICNLFLGDKREKTYKSKVILCNSFT